MKTFTDLIEGRGIEPKSAFKKFWSSYARGRNGKKTVAIPLGWVQQEAERLGVKPDEFGQLSSPELTRAVVRQFEIANKLKPTGATL